ncbi:COX15/CtaA family protein [Gilvibacter sp.]|uniref:COX15/CtaA family protein n=1 Tax=Gilvibacter sp. TaxID=2729997 RepID=UPI003F4A79D3
MFVRFVRISLILIYLVIIAGAVVRMTGSGMGCPDWPKCFGYYIPPADEATLLWEADREFKKGQVIIKDESLEVAKADFTTGSEYSAANWEAYTEHDYAIFNVWHTWIEYINRLLGALSGLAILIMAILSIWKWKQNKWLTLLSWLSVFMIGFQGWLGATVVYSVLAPVRITIHMVMALLIVLVLLLILRQAIGKQRPQGVTGKYKTLLWAALGLTLIQIVLGTQVRQFVDDQVKMVGYEAKEAWLAYPELNFYIHRSFSILVVLINVLLWRGNQKNGYSLYGMNGIMVILGIEVLTGIAMYYFDFPFLTQPIHLVFAGVLFGLQSYLILQVLIPRKTVKIS